MRKDEIYLSSDVETNGPIPGPNAMLSFGTAAFTLKDGLISTFSANLEELPGSSMDPKTKTEFWDKNPEAWAVCRKDPQPIEPTLKRYVEWANGLPGKRVFVGYPATFDFMFMYWYFVKYGLESPFGFSGRDITSYVAGYLGCEFQDATKGKMPKEWFPETKHTHIALDDAIEQGELFLNIVRARLAEGWTSNTGR